MKWPINALFKLSDYETSKNGVIDEVENFDPRKKNYKSPKLITIFNAYFCKNGIEVSIFKLHEKIWHQFDEEKIRTFHFVLQSSSSFNIKILKQFIN